MKLHVPCCSYSCRYFFHIRISANFYVDLSATLLNFQYSSRSSNLVNLMTPQNLPALCCNFTRMFFTWNSWNNSIFMNFQTSPWSGCMLNMITPQELHVSSYNITRGSRHLNLCRAKGFRHQRCLFLKQIHHDYSLVISSSLMQGIPWSASNSMRCVNCFLPPPHCTLFGPPGGYSHTQVWQGGSSVITLILGNVNLIGSLFYTSIQSDLPGPSFCRKNWVVYHIQFQRYQDLKLVYYLTDFTWTKTMWMSVD